VSKPRFSWAFLFAPVILAQTNIAIKPISPAGVTGPEMFVAYCATCHGVDGKGAGPAASGLKTPVPDLTKIAQRNGGKFDQAKIAMMLGLMPSSGAHGGTEMPVWGDLFRASHNSEIVVRQRVSNLVTHLETLQDPPLKRAAKTRKPVVERVPLTAAPISSGPKMFQAYCSSCHGADAKGNGPMANSLKAQPKDLTQLAVHNGGKFPAEKIMGLLGNMPGTEAHGSKEMPVWGDVLRSVERPEAVKLRLMNITTYLKSIQVN
jgi:mono/diheme cytochrome c family protein